MKKIALRIVVAASGIAGLSSAFAFTPAKFANTIFAIKNTDGTFSYTSVQPDGSPQCLSNTATACTLSSTATALTLNGLFHTSFPANGRTAPAVTYKSNLNKIYR
ncbi:MAG TPA: hypothetical protein VK518_19310 [Puia sp.]|nr:hypothetical protein [Puia sp.]